MQKTLNKKTVNAIAHNIIVGDAIASAWDFVTSMQVHNEFEYAFCNSATGDYCDTLWHTTQNVKLGQSLDLIDQNDICLFMKGTPEAPQCGFSMAVSNVLKHLNAKFKSVNVLEDQNLRQGIKDFSDWPTIPQLYVKGEFIGGCDIVKDMFEKGELKKILEEKKLI